MNGGRFARTPWVLVLVGVLALLLLTTGCPLELGGGGNGDGDDVEDDIDDDDDGDDNGADDDADDDGDDDGDDDADDDGDDDGTGTLVIQFAGSPSSYFDGLAGAESVWIVAEEGDDPLDASFQPVDQGSFTTTGGAFTSTSITVDTGAYDVYCWFDVGTNPGFVEESDHAAWELDVAVLEDTETVVSIDHTVMTGTIAMPPAQDLDQSWTEARMLAVLTVWDDTLGEFIDLEEAGITASGTDHLGYTFRNVDLPAATIKYVIDITALEDILDAEGENPCYLAALLAEGDWDDPASDPWDFTSGDWYGFYGYPDEPLLVTDPDAGTPPNVQVSDAGLTDVDFALTQQIP